MTLFDTGVIPIINDHLLEESKKVRDYGSYWSASQAGYCMRKVIFERLGVPPVEEDARKQRLFSAGHIFHDWIQKLTKQAGVSIAQEAELKDEFFKIKGHFDDLVKVEDQYILYDYKTKHAYWFEYAKTKSMSHYHRMQLGTYLYLIRQSKEFAKLNITESRILSISKDDLRMFEEQLMWTPQLEQDVKDYWTELNKWWKSRKIPPCTCDLYEVNSKTGKGFMADPKWNPYYYHDEPCSMDWYNEFKLEKELAEGKS